MSTKIGNIQPFRQVFRQHWASRKIHPSALDGNGQLFLCLQDICQQNFLEIFKQVKSTTLPRK